jgi:hypothetical protein
MGVWSWFDQMQYTHMRIAIFRYRRIWLLGTCAYDSTLLDNMHLSVAMCFEDIMRLFKGMHLTHCGTSEVYSGRGIVSAAENETSSFFTVVLFEVLSSYLVKSFV